MNLESEQLEAIDTILADTMEHWDVPGAAIAIVTGDTIHTECRGHRNVEKKANVTPSTVFPLASITKSFTAMGLGLLVDEDVLNWDDPVREHLPDFRLYSEELTANVTVRDLLSHRTGLPRHELVAYKRKISQRDVIHKLRYLEPTKRLREAWQYQNFMFTTAGYLAGQLAGTSWEEFTQTRILGALAMNDTTPRLAEFKERENRAQGYWYPSDKLEPLKDYTDRTPVAPAGATFSNITDLATWLCLHLNKGSHDGNQFIQQRTLAEMHKPQMLIPTDETYQKLYQSPFLAYGLGWHIQPYQGHTLIYHGGGITGFSTLAMFMPKEDLGIAVLSNNDRGYFCKSIAYQTFDLLLELSETNWNEEYRAIQEGLEREQEESVAESHKAQKPNTQPSHPLEHYSGVYEHAAYPPIVISQNNQGDLEGKLLGETWPVEHYHYDIFELVMEPYEWRCKLYFQTDAKGEIASLTAQVEPQLEPALFKKADD